MRVEVSRFELYPKEDPTSYVVGFKVTANNNRSFYRDILIPINEEETRTDEEIAIEAFTQVKAEIDREIMRLNERSPLLGSLVFSENGDYYIGDKKLEPVVETPEIQEFVEDPPVEDPPVEDPPVEDPPVEDPPVEDPPVEEETTEGGGE